MKRHNNIISHLKILFMEVDTIFMDRTKSRILTDSVIEKANEYHHEMIYLHFQLSHFMI